MSASIIEADCRDAMRKMDANSIDAIVTDPPYHLTTGKKGGSGQASENLDSPAGRSRATTGFMGKTWDGGDIAHDPSLWSEVFRVAKPGAHLLAFGGTRTFHRLTCAIEDAGFEIRDCVMWIFGSGFPKSRNLDGAWQGWGTALKPAWEPIIMARKPLRGTVAANVEEFRTGALNIDGCRIETADALGGGAQKRVAIEGKHEGWARPWMHDAEAVQAHAVRVNANVAKAETLGRWPANVIHDGSDEVLQAFPDAPGQQADLRGDEPSRPAKNVYGEYKKRRVFNKRDDEASALRRYETSGSTNFAALPGERRAATSAARFFYCAKADRADRDEGLHHRDKKPMLWSSGEQSPGTFQSPNTDRAARNHHPTVKPVDLMRYLCRLVTPPGGTVLDPFCGSGSTGKAAMLEGFDFIGIELDPEYAAIARDRIYAAAPLFASEVA